MKWLVVIGAALLVQCTAMPAEEDDDTCEEHASFEICAALRPMTINDMLDPESRAKRQTGDGLLEKLIWEKLRIFSWIVGKIGGPAAEQFVRSFIGENREAVTQALRQGGSLLISLLIKIVTAFLMVG